MAEFTANAVQQVPTNRDVLFTETPICGNCSVMHRQGSGLVTLKGISKQCRARFKVTFGGNIRIPTGGTIAPISLNISLEGEPMSSAAMIYTPTALNAFGNVSSSIFIDVPCGCCVDVSVRNTSTQTIEVQNANLIVERVA